MDCKVILASAGSGKTYTICHQIDPEKRNLILAFTNENIHNILNELENAFGNIPSKTIISTFSSFLYHHCVLPFEPLIGDTFHRPEFKSKGICICDPPPKTIKIKNKKQENQFKKKYITNPFYIKKSSIEHYLLNNCYYAASLSELVNYVKNYKLIIERLNKFFDCILIDEFQDFRMHDFDLVLKIMEKCRKVICVGDYYQHSVSGRNNSGKPYESYNTEDRFKEYLKSLKCQIDDTTLSKSRRCPEKICNFVNKVLGINIKSLGINNGDIFWIGEDRINEILENDTVVKLVPENAQKYKFNALNWSYSKGDTFDNVCVILNGPTSNIDIAPYKEDSNSKGITKNKLYVALTRTKGNLYLVKNSVFSKVKNNYM